MLDMFNEKFFDNNNCHLKFLSMEVQLLDEAGILRKNLGIPKLAIRKEPIKPDSLLHL
jgi:hypothetical protein